MIPKVTGEKILIASLNWGWGHVSRTIGLINQLIQNQNEVLIACSEDQLRVFKLYFPDLEYKIIKDYPFQFNGKGNFGLDLLFSSSRYIQTIKKELKNVEELVQDSKPTLIISDHRYGFRNPEIKSIFLTHQLHLPLKWWQISFQRIHERYMKEFDEVWVCDTESNEFAGSLSHSLTGVKCVYIGVISRFQFYDFTNDKEGEVVVVSGPNPYNEQLIDVFQGAIADGAKVLGATDLLMKKKVPFEQCITNWKAGDECLLKAKKIYSYSGYSTIMDLSVLKCEAELIATKGQAEQIYLLERFNK